MSSCSCSFTKTRFQNLAKSKLHFFNKFSTSPQQASTVNDRPLRKKKKNFLSHRWMTGMWHMHFLMALLRYSPILADIMCRLIRKLNSTQFIDDNRDERLFLPILDHLRGKYPRLCLLNILSLTIICLQVLTI